MSRFSQRHGYTPAERVFQRESIDSALRTKLWNALRIAIWEGYDPDDYSKRKRSELIDFTVRRLWIHYFNRDLDTLPSFHTRYSINGYYDILKDYFFSCKWYEVYDFLEEISHDKSDLLEDDGGAARKWINHILEEYNSAYRFVGKDIAEITDSNEIEAIDNAIGESGKPVRMHLEAALKMLSDRETPDYRNSIKESISAVEAACREATKQPAATLGDALKNIQNIHPAMQRAFGQLYGYTSDASGIRHSLSDESNITYSDAKFMLVACSAFISYLKASAANA